MKVEVEDKSVKSQVEALREQEEKLGKIFGEAFLSLADDQTASLSAVLFPETFTTKVPFCGVERELHALPIKVSKLIQHKLKPFSDKHNEALRSETSVSLNDEAVEGLKQFAVTVAEHYRWENVKELIEAEEVSIPELQRLAVMQNQIEGANNFLLGSLRILIRLMQVYEIGNVKFSSTFTSRSFAKSLVAPSMPSSQNTPQVKSP